MQSMKISGKIYVLKLLWAFSYFMCKMRVVVLAEELQTRTVYDDDKMSANLSADIKRAWCLWLVL